MPSRKTSARVTFTVGPSIDGWWTWPGKFTFYGQVQDPAICAVADQEPVCDGPVTVSWRGQSRRC